MHAHVQRRQHAYCAIQLIFIRFIHVLCNYVITRSFMKRPLFVYQNQLVERCRESAVLQWMLCYIHADTVLKLVVSSVAVSLCLCFRLHHHFDTIAKLRAQEGSQAVIAVGYDFCIQTCQLQCNLVTVPLYTLNKLYNSSNWIYTQFRNHCAIGIVSSQCSDTLATSLRFLNHVDPRTCDLTII